MKKIFAAFSLGLALICCGCGDARVRQVQSTDTVMGTVIQQKLYTTDRETEAAQDILALLRKLEETELSRRQDTSEIGKLNASAGGKEGIPVSAFMEEILTDCITMWQMSEGAFDVTLGSVVSLWDIDGWAAGERGEAFALPERAQVEEALEYCGSGKLSISGGCLYLPEGMQLDLGAVGKGIGLDDILSYLQEKDEITGAIISLGGSVLTYGKKPDGKPWNVGIADPGDRSSNVGVLTLEGQWFISTSGDYERFVELDGVRYHHIIDPATGYPADSGVAGVTVLAAEGSLSDALSTACFILGEEKGMALAESCGAEVLFVRRDGSIAMSDGMRKYYRPGQ